MALSEGNKMNSTTSWISAHPIHQRARFGKDSLKKKQKKQDMQI